MENDRFPILQKEELDEREKTKAIGIETVERLASESRTAGVFAGRSDHDLRLEVHRVRNCCLRDGIDLSGQSGYLRRHHQGVHDHQLSAAWGWFGTHNILFVRS